MVRRAATLLLLAIATLAGAARADTFIHITGTAGDYISQGTARHLTAADGTIAVTKDASGAIVATFHSSSPTGPIWNLGFAAASGPTGVGAFESSERYPFQTAGHPGLDVSGDGRGCNKSIGRFFIGELTFAADGSVASFAADFEQHCEFFGAAAYGGVRFNSSVPYVDVAPAIPPGWFRMTRAADGATPAIDIYRENNNRQMSGLLYGHGADVSYQDGTLEYWATFFSTDVFGPNVPLTPGVYESARNQVAGHPALYIAGWGPSCDPVSGRFVVYEAEIAPYGNVVRFAADFSAYCGGSSNPTYGGVRYNSTVPYTQIAPPPPIATGLQYIDATHSYRVTNGASLSGIQFATVDSTGNRIANQAVTATATCGLFANGFANIAATSDSSGVVTLPQWTAPTGPVTCSIFAYLSPNNGSSITFQIDVSLPAPPPPAIATHFAMIDGSNTFYTTPGGTVTGVHFATVDDNQARVGNQAVTITSLDGTHCGSFSGATTLSLASDANGVLSLPAHTAAMSVTNCVWKAELVAAPANYLVFYFNTGDPFGVLTPLRLEVRNHTGDYTIASTGFLENVEVAAVSTGGTWIRQRGIQFTSVTPSCGSFAGSPQVQVLTDEGGVAVMPRWTPTGQVSDCAIAMDFVGTQGLTSTIQLHISGIVAPPGPTPPGTTPPGPTTPVTTASGTSPQGGAINLTIVAATPQCSLSRTSFIDPALISPPVAPAPEGIAAPHGLIDFRVDNCGSGQSVTFNVDFPQDLPPTAQWWKYGPTMDNRTSHWYVIPSTLSGKRITFNITDGGLGDDDLTMNGSISDVGMLAIPNGVMQDLWWSGPGENGWGMSIVQHRDVLFANMFVYDASGAPTWYVMPSGSWNSDHTVYTGNLYLPKGSPFYQYDVTKFDIGTSVGTARLTFSDANNASFDYTISGITGHKSITRIPFGPQSPPTDKPLGDLWWAGSVQNGWGIALLQQYSSLFGLWFTYDANGKPTWFVMPSGSWVVKDDWQGKIYRAEGPPWLGVTYDVSRHKLTEVGTFRYRFSGDGATFDYTVDGHTGSIPLSRIPF